MKRQRNDSAFGYASSASFLLSTPTEAELNRLFAAGDRLGRSYSMGLTKRRTIEIVVSTKTAHRTVELPTIIRGRLVTNAREFIALEIEKPVALSLVPPISSRA